MRDFIALLLTLLLAFPAAAQEQPAPVMMPGLKVLVLQGAGAVNNIKSGAITTPVVEVRDENDRPVEGAEVIFRLPASGPGGFFADQRSTFRTRTNSQGQAACPRFSLSSTPGRFQILVTATSENRMGQAAIDQTNSTDRFQVEEVTTKRGSRKWLWIGLAGAGAAAAGIILATRNGSSSSGSVYTVTPGAVTVGAPR